MDYLSIRLFVIVTLVCLTRGDLSPKEEVEQIRALARMIRQTENPSELTVQNLLLWLQGKYEAQTRRARQQQSAPAREYLPSDQSNNNNNVVGLPRPFQKPTQPPPFRRPAGPLSTPSRPQPPAPPRAQPPAPPRGTPRPPIRPSGPYPQPSDQPDYRPYPATGSTPTPGFDYPNRPSSTPDPNYDFPSRPGSTGYPQPSPPSRRPPSSTPQYPQYDSTTNNDVSGGDAKEEGGDSGVNENEVEELEPTDPGPSPDDTAHPPHIHDIQVQCAKDQMTITIEFNRAFDGVIYSKGFYNSEKCRYVLQNSGQTKYTFTVSLDSCGTQFVDQFAQGGQAYLENVLVLQNEPGIQEVWDTVRTVRCLWEGSIKQDLSVSLAIGMLSQEVVTFSGDTGKARLDIQIGKGPFGQPANGLVKIGETMTLVVYVEGDAGFDIVVRECQARDTAGVNSIQLFDERGCVLKPKLFGGFQKTRETGNTGASLIAYAYFSAFKFPDEMDLVLECNVELCKADCEMCPDEQKYDPGRKRRDLRLYSNESSDNAHKISGRFRVIATEDLAELQHREHLVAFIPGREGICMSTEGFLISSVLVLGLLVISSITSATFWLKLQRNKL